MTFFSQKLCRTHSKQNSAKKRELYNENEKLLNKGNKNRAYLEMTFSSDAERMAIHDLYYVFKTQRPLFFREENIVYPASPS